MKALKKIEIEADVVLHEQLALKRLRRSSLNPPPLVRQRRWISAWRGLLLLVVRPVELVREVSPDHPPLARDQWERLDHLGVRIR